MKQQLRESEKFTADKNEEWKKTWQFVAINEHSAVYDSGENNWLQYLFLPIISGQGSQP